MFDQIETYFVWATGYDLFRLPFAVGVFYCSTDWPLLSAFAGSMMAFSSVSVVMSSLLLWSYKEFAVGMFYCWADWPLLPAFAGSTMAFSSVSVVTSSLLLRSYKEPSILGDGIMDEWGDRVTVIGESGRSTQLPGR